MASSPRHVRIARWLSGAIVGVALALAGPGSLLAASATPVEARAATIIGMLRFVEWDSASARAGVLRVAVVGDRELAAALRKASIAVRPAGRAVAIVDVASAAAVTGAGAAVVVVGALPASDTTALLRRLADQAVLTVGAGDCPDNTALMLNLVADGDRYRFIANPVAATRAGLTLSSRLLRLADIVE